MRRREELYRTYEVIRFMYEHKINLSELAKQCDYNVWELRGAVSSGGLGSGTIGMVIREALEYMTLEKIETGKYDVWDMKHYSISCKSQGSKRMRQYDLYCVEDNSYDSKVIDEYVTMLYGGKVYSICYRPN